MPLSRRSPHRSLLALIAVLGALFPIWMAGASAASALPPRPASSATPTIAQVRARLATLTVTEQRVTEAFDAAGVALHSALLREGRLTAQAAALGRAARAAHVRLEGLAVAAYESGGILPGSLALLNSAGPQAMAERASDLQLVTRVQALDAVRLTDAVRELRAVRLSVAAVVRTERALAGQLAADRDRVAATIAAEAALLGRLSTAQRAQVLPVALGAITFALPRVSGRAGVAVRFAYAQLGKPYQWGAAGPNSYDCSGLTMAAWGAAGVSLPHSAADQQAMLPVVPAGQLAPGDLIFFGAPAYHVGIYIGSGRMIHAPYTGTDVQIGSISGYTSAGRP
ncbi:MAG: C40 family peptidase [Mycobacteriales bacterium]